MNSLRPDWQVGATDLVVEVEGDGPGVASDANLFVAFFKTKPLGSGIGLILSRARCYRASGSPRGPVHATLERVSTAVAGSPRVNAIREALAAFPEVRLALLFGSEAKGTARRGSDVDLAVEAPVSSLGQIAAALSSRLGAEVDVVRLETATIPLLEALIADGIVLHEGKRGAGALWRSRVLAQLETDRPWYRRQRDAWLQRVAEHGFSRG